MFATPKQTGRSSLLGRSPLAGAAFSGRRSLQPTPRTTPSIATKVARAEHILEETDLHVIKALNYPVPVQVQESLKANHREASIKLQYTGWAWLIGGGKLLLWKYAAQQFSVQCYQLRLPGHGWSSNLVTIYQRPGAGEPQLSVLACSSDGGLFYWANILRNTSVACEGSINVEEGHAYSVTSLPDGLGCVVATTTASMFVVTPPTSMSSQSGLSVRHLQLPHGMFSGIGCKMSSLFFGSITSEAQETRKVTVADEQLKGSKVTSVFLLTNANLQKWHVEVTSEQLVYDVAISHMIKEAVIQDGWVESATPIDAISMWLVDMQLSTNHVAVLFGMRCEGKTTMEHGLALFPVVSDVTPSVSRVVKLNHTVDCPVGREQLALEFSLHGAPSTPTVVLHNKSAILLANINVTSPSPPDVVKFPPPDLILGSGHLHSQLLLFTLHQGVVSLSQTTVASSTATSTASAPSQSMKTPATLSRPHTAMLTTPTQSVGGPISPSRSSYSLDASIETLKNAFSEYLDGNLAAAKEIVDHHLPEDAFQSGVVGDLSVVQLSEMVLDDPPVTSDPRWADTLDGSGVTSGGKSLILIYRLEQKFQAHSRYVQFVSDVGLLDRLTSIRVRGRPMLTRLLLCEHAEKIQAAITLRKLHNQIVDYAINIALHGRSSSLSVHPTLSKSDLFYTHLSQLEDIFPALLRHEEEALGKMDDPKKRLELITGVGTILDSVLRDALFYRQSKLSLYQPCSTTTAPEHVQLDSLPWTASDTPQGMKNCLLEQIQVMLSFNKKDFPSSQERKDFWSLYVRLVDLLCDGYVTQLKELESQSDKYGEVKRTYETQRHKCLLPLLEYQQYHHTIELGEKYEDFHVLVHLCEELEDKNKLKEYMTRFSAQRFSDFLFKQYLDKGRLKKLLSYSEDFPRELSAFLKPHDSLSWLHHTATKEYGKVYEALERMAGTEMQYAAKKKTLLSLSKLALLASSEDDKEDKVRSLNERLHHIEVQQSLPSDVLEANGCDADMMPPLPPSEVIELYVGEGNPTSNELQFITALQYLDFAFPERDEARPIRANIWSYAVLKDDWSQLSTDNPLAELQGTFFFRVVEEAFSKGLDMLALLPDLNSLLVSPKLAEKGLSEDPAFRLLMKSGYEQVARVQSHMATYASTGQELQGESLT